MDAAAPLAGQLVAILSPFLPQLLGAAQNLAQGAASEVENNAWGVAKQLWHTLRPQVEAKSSAQEAANDVVANPTDEDSVAAFRKELRKLLSEDPALSRALQQIVEQGERSGAVQVTAHGTRAVAIGGNVSGAAIVPGDHNSIQR